MCWRAAGLPDDALLELAAQRAVVLWNRQVAGLPSVVTDSADAGRQIIEHLAALGHRTLTYLGGPAKAWADGERWRALSQAAERAGIEVLRRGPFSPTLDGRLGGGRHRDGERVDRARRVQRPARHRRAAAAAAPGRRRPAEVSVVGFDDIFGSDFCQPPLTTVTAPLDQAGRMLVDLLLGEHGKEHDAQHPPSIVLPAVLRVRDSTGPAGTGRRQTAR